MQNSPNIEATPALRSFLITKFTETGRLALGGWLVLVLAVAISKPAHAGVFNIPHFVAPGEFAVGLEPELTLSNGAGFATNLKYTQGITELMNGQFIIGTGGGPRQFRVGGNLAFDFFPDIEGQPGLGFATQALYYRLKGNVGQLDVTAIPYIHKSFKTGSGMEFDPFFSVPFGLGLTDGRYKTISTAVLGSSFKGSEHFRYSIELGVSINNAETYFSGGVTYYH